MSEDIKLYDQSLGLYSPILIRSNVLIPILFLYTSSSMKFGTLRTHLILESSGTYDCIFEKLMKEGKFLSLKEEKKFLQESFSKFKKETKAKAALIYLDMGLFSRLPSAARMALFYEMRVRALSKEMIELIEDIPLFPIREKTPFQDYLFIISSAREREFIKKTPHIPHIFIKDIIERMRSI